MAIISKCLIFASIIVLGFGLMRSPLNAGDVSVTGFADLIYTVTDDGTPGNEETFTIDGEVDFIADRDPFSVRRLHLPMDSLARQDHSQANHTARSTPKDLVYC